MKPLMAGEMTFLHGIRSIAIIIIVLGHSYAFSFWNVPVMNAIAILDMVKMLPTMFVFSGYFGVDSFFMLSALLLSMSVFRELQKT